MAPKFDKPAISQCHVSGSQYVRSTATTFSIAGRVSTRVTQMLVAPCCNSGDEAWRSVSFKQLSTGTFGTTSCGVPWVVARIRWRGAASSTHRASFSLPPELALGNESHLFETQVKNVWLWA